MKLNRAQRIIFSLSLIALAIIGLQNTLFKPQCLNTMCPAHDMTVWYRLGIVIAATVGAMWVMRSVPAKPEGGSSQASVEGQPSEPSDTPTPEA